jgi:glycosyltransferase involved in cell wall biosynthesis
VQNNPLVSVIIPVYNCERYLAEAVESVLAQSHRPVEVIVVDDGSTDDSAKVARRFAPEVRCYVQARGGAAAARNKGLELAQGSLFAFLDADDLWVEDKLTIQLAVVNSDRGVDMAFGHVVHFHSPDLDERTRARIQCPSEADPGCIPGTMLITRQAFVRAGPFETGWRIGEFIDWYARAVDVGLRSVMLPQVLLKRRLHANNTGLRERHARSDYARILKVALDRRRRTRGPSERSSQADGDTRKAEPS